MAQLATSNYILYWVVSLYLTRASNSTITVQQWKLCKVVRWPVIQEEFRRLAQPSGNTCQSGNVYIFLMTLKVIYVESNSIKFEFHAQFLWTRSYSDAIYSGSIWGSRISLWFCVYHLMPLWVGFSLINFIISLARFCRCTAFFAPCKFTNFGDFCEVRWRFWNFQGNQTKKWQIF